ncbi:hypothetical protein [Kineococcus sp. SYSU DK003]|uniref:hypothetical protein n=1 Tax=Kineococcus sp. SYSU DK003 TaxID=3383124 RepID=UPI003D7EBC02
MHRRTIRTLTLVAVPLAVVGVAAGTAGAATGPQDTEAITQAVTTSEQTAAVPPADYRVTDVRVADSDTSWAAADLEPTDPAALDPATAVLQHVEGGWRVVDLGTAQVGCGLATPAVLEDLTLSC